MKALKERKPDVSARKLKAAGYRYKLQELTKEEKKVQREGVKETDPVTNRVRTYDPPDMNYFYKVIGDVTVKIFKAGDRFYYKNAWFRYMDKLPALEALAKEDHKYELIQEQVIDTKPLADTPTKQLAPGLSYIELVGGPLEGTAKAWNLAFPSCMIQFTDDDGKVKSARYQREMPIVEIDGRKQRVNDRRNIYKFLDIIE
jgi:hypothetical protein